MPIELIPLATVKLKPATPIMVGDVGTGIRMVIEIESATWEGDRLKARQLGSAAADWPLIGSDGIGRIDVRSVLQTDDDALIYVRYEGRALTDAGVSTLYVTPVFETAAPQYAWLNRVQAIAKGRIGDDGLLTYEVYEIR